MVGKKMKTRLLIIVFGIIFLSYLASFEQVYISAQEQNTNMKVEAPPLSPEDYRKGETLSNTWVAMLIEGLGAALIVLFIVIYAIKKKAKGASKHDNN
jgi:hypothetical protein